jgi:hypothetical protein
MRDRALTDWLPPVLQPAREYRVFLNDAVQPETDLLWDLTGILRSEQFIETAGENGVSRWEGMMRLLPSGNLRERKDAVIKRLFETPLFNEKTLHSTLEELCGGERFTVQIDHIRCVLTVGVVPSVPIEAVSSMLSRRLPANIAFHIEKLYATHRCLRIVRHRELAGIKHKYIKEAI